MTRSESGRGSVNGSTSGSTNGQLLPTTVGSVNHDPTRPRAPCYSIGGRFTERTRPSPGPQYKVEGGLTSKGTGHSPSFTLTGRPKRSMFETLAASSGQGPGPNAYSVPPLTHTSLERKPPMFSIGLPYASSSTSAANGSSRYSRYAPAPNSYTLPSTLGARVPHVRGGPASTLQGKGSVNKGFSFDHAQTPGPAGYGPVDPGHTTRRAPAVTLKGRPKLPPIKFVTPGPGAYDPSQGENRVNKASPRFSMGVRHGDKVKPLFTLADVSQ
ncbi:ciliary microtubule associated protein 1B-like [Babylonia areolata]|uniref:ciliary microtubule associated protein 1B-like n=1 Tax=Babylonia areolata TaxID=304850 RepID=UPI003FD1AF05